MAETKTFTLSDVAEHNTKKDLYMVVHDKVYDATAFVDEHPGGEEVMLDVGGQDASEAFEDVGHSDEAREILQGMLVGDLKRAPGEAAPKKTAPPPGAASTSGGSDSGMGMMVYVALLVAGVAAYFGYSYMGAAQDGKTN